MIGIKIKKSTFGNDNSDKHDICGITWWIGIIKISYNWYEYSQLTKNSGIP